MFEVESFSCSSKDGDEPCQDKIKGAATKQRSCASVNTPLPCINKTIHRIQELELKVEKCLQQHDYVFKEEKMPCQTKHVSAEAIEAIWLSFSTKLDFKEADESYEDTKTLTLKQETEALLLEVTELIKRLEADREEAEKALELEKQRSKKLGMKIDSMSLWRLQQLPAVVQKEREMYAKDISELRGHFDCKSCQLRQVQTQILQTERANREIQEDIDFVKKHSPLLEEKLKLEAEAVKDVLVAYDQASKIHGDVRCELMEIQEAMKRLDEESEGKIKSMYEEIKYAEMQLSECKNELKHSEFIWTEYCMKLKETEEKIRKDEKHLEELVKQKAEIQEDAKCWNSKIEALNNELSAQGDEGMKMSDAFSEVIKAVEELKSTGESDLQNMRQRLLSMRKALDILKCENGELEGENEKFLQKFRKSSRKKKMYQSEVETIYKSMSEIEQKIARAKEDLCSAELSYSKTKRKYERLNKSKTTEEISYKNSEWDVQKEIQDQKGIVKTTRVRIKEIHDELEEKQKEKLKKRKEDMKRIEEMEKQVADLETKCKRKKDKFKDSCEKLCCLDQRVQELNERQKQTEEQLEPERSAMQQHLHDIQEENSFVCSQIAKNSHTMENLKKELKELNDLWNRKQIQMEKTEKSLADLWKNLSGVMFKQQSSQLIFNHLQDELAEYDRRLKEEERTYEELLQIRKEKLKESEAALDEAIQENMWLSQEYKIFQRYYLNSKEELLEHYDNRIRAEAAFRDHQQVRALQRRWRGALAGRRSRGGLCIPAGLASIQAASQENAQKILAVQGELSKAIQHVTAFLHSLTDGSPIPDNNANNQCALDAERGDKKSHTVQITV